MSIAPMTTTNEMNDNKFSVIDVSSHICVTGYRGLLGSAISAAAYFCLIKVYNDSGFVNAVVV